MMKSRLSILFVLVVFCLCPVYGAPFKIAVLPDTQQYSENYPTTFTAQTNWIVNNKTAQSIAFVTQLGDIVNKGAKSGEMYQWTNADNAIDVLDGDLPYSVCIGNHDYDIPHDKNDPFNGADTYKSYFGSSRYSSYTWYGGASPLGLSHYQIFTAGGRQWLHLNFEWEPDNSILMWAQNVIDAHSTLPVIMSTHAFIGMRIGDLNDVNNVGFRGATTGAAANGGSEAWYKFVSHNDQIFMVLNGHFEGEESTKLQNDYGHDVFFLHTDYQYRDNGGDGWLRLYEIDLDNNHINAETYSPKLNSWETDANSQFTLNVNFNTRFNFGSREQINGIKAANIKVTNNPVFDVNVIPGQTTGGLTLVPAGTNSYTGQNKGDYYVQVGQRCEDDTMAGVLIASIAQNGATESGITWYHTPAANIWGHGQISIGVQITDFNGPDGYGGWYLYTDKGEGDANVAAAYFPFSQFIGAHCEELADNKIYSAMGNGIVFGDNLTQYPNYQDDPCLVVQKTAGDPWPNDNDRGVYDITIPGANSLTDGIILSNTNNNQDNYTIVSPYNDGSGWQLAIKDNSGTSATEAGGFSFVYVPYSTPGIVAGRFRHNSGEIVAGTGGFKAEPIVDGKTKLRIYGCNPADGALLIQGESQCYNADDFHTYAPDDVNGCWIIESRDLPEAKLAGTTTEHYVFAFIPFDGNVVPFDGNGTPSDPYKIYTKAQLEAVDWWPAAHFKLMNDIDLTGTTYTQAVICPDSNNVNDEFNGTAFTGSFNGNGKTISNLTISGGDNDYVALFGSIGEDGQVFGLTLANAAISTTGFYAAALVGESNGDVNDCHSSGTVSGERYAGGLLGSINGGDMLNSSTSATVAGGFRVGGLTGYAANGTIEGCSATGNVTGANTATDANYTMVTGGLIGMASSNAIVNNCYATGIVTGVYRVGGLIGNSFEASIANSHATGNVIASGVDITNIDNYYVGGLIGQNYTSDVNYCYAEGAVTGGTTQDRVGGLVGNTYLGTINNSYATGAVSGSGWATGGLLGYNQGGTLKNSHATGNVTVTDGGDGVGGCVGYSRDSGLSAGMVDNCYATGAVSGDDESVGGFIGSLLGTTSNRCSVTNCYSTGAVTTPATANQYIGGFIGHNQQGIISGCHSEGAVNSASTDTYQVIGGFVGYNLGIKGGAAASIRDCYSNSTVIATHARYQIGGFVGSNELNADINDCYATGSVTAGGNDAERIGGFAGYNKAGTINNSHATGNVTVTDSGAVNVGGFVGYMYSAAADPSTIITNSYATGNVYNEYQFTGGFAGYISTNAYITNCYATGSVASANNYNGGFIGRSAGGGTYISSCYATGNVNSNYESGGFGGRLSSNSVVQNCYSTGSATSVSARAGGFAGGAYGTITNCYATGTATADANVGGFAGFGSIVNANCFWDTQTSGLMASSGELGCTTATGKTTAQMKQLATFTNWDFTTAPIWNIRETLSYPKLNWQVFDGGDIDWNDTVNFTDLMLLVDNWLATGTGLPGDIIVDNKVNFLDFAEFASDWVAQ